MTLSELLEVDLALLPERDLAPVPVAVVDTGVDSTHPDLKGRVVSSHRVVEDERGWHLEEVALPANNDPFGHGTGVASLIAQVAPNARIVDIRVAEPRAVGVGESLVAGIGAALQLDLPVINLSLVCHRSFLDPLVHLCEVAYRLNRIVVAARRNIPIDDDGIPAELSSAIGVDSDDFPSPYAFRFRLGHPIECTARGEQVIVAAPGGRYTVQTGTSYATSTVAGLCALLRGLSPEVTAFEVKSVLKEIARRSDPR